jgi:hypothetical protein
MLTWRYSKEAPEGRLFDTEGREHPLPPSELNGWFDCRSKIQITRDELIDAVVRADLAKQESDRVQLEGEFEKKTGDKPHVMAKSETLIKVLDDPHAKERKRR